MFNSNEEYFSAVRAYIDKLNGAGFNEEAEVITKALSSINGLSDGWAIYLDFLLTIETKLKSGKLLNFSQEHEESLKEFIDVAYKAVYRRNRTEG